jgi:autotransporter strand-loop-strand O-heptosyltransferase
MFNCNRLLVITPHLSTGGCPQYLLEFLKKFQNNFEQIKVVEFSNYSNAYTIQKEKIKKIIGGDNLITLGYLGDPEPIFTENRKKLINIILDYNPEIIWLNESFEVYDYEKPPSEVIEIIYNKDRKHKIIETTHHNAFNFDEKKFIPDEFMFCSVKHITDSKNLNVPKVVWDIPIENKVRPDRTNSLLELGLSPEKLHVLHVGLFHQNKNQKYIFEIAKKLSNVEFHFIGNHCFLNNCDIGENLTLENCNVWGERSDVEKFMSCMDIFLFPSFRELNPISVKEALSWGMQVIVRKDENYTDQYKDLNNFYLMDEINVEDFIKERDIYNQIIVTYQDGVKVEILGEKKHKYLVRFFDDNTNLIVHQSNIENNMWTMPSRKYYVKWRIEIFCDGLKIMEKKLNLKDKKVLIIYESKSLGDSIAWVPYIEEFRKKHECQVYCASFRNFLFEKSYPDINWVTIGTNPKNYYAVYRLGWFYNQDKNPSDVRLIPLQKTSSDILGLDFREIRPKIDFTPNFENTYGKYVTISVHSTSQCKYWNKIGGWDKVVEYLNNEGYNVVCVDQYEFFGSNNLMNRIPKNTIKEVGQDFDRIMQLIYHAEFHIGLGSGDTWLAWSLGKKVLQVSSFSKPFCEFQSDCFRVYKESPNSGYFNSTDFKFDASKWDWNPIQSCSTFDDWDKFEPIEIEDVIHEIQKML